MTILDRQYWQPRTQAHFTDVNIDNVPSDGHMTPKRRSRTSFVAEVENCRINI